MQPLAAKLARAETADADRDAYYRAYHRRQADARADDAPPPRSGWVAGLIRAWGRA